MNIGDEIDVKGKTMTVISFDSRNFVGVSEDESGLQVIHVVDRELMEEVARVPEKKEPVITHRYIYPEGSREDGGGHPYLFQNEEILPGYNAYFKLTYTDGKFSSFKFIPGTIFCDT